MSEPDAGSDLRNTRTTTGLGSDHRGHASATVRLSRDAERGQQAVALGRQSWGL
jgi:hypothetical protein